MAPTANNIIAGPAAFFTAPLGTALPPLTGASEWPIVFPSGWTEAGYTDTGVDSTYSPTLKSYTPDEEASPVYDILQAEKFEMSVTLAEATMDNYALAVSLSTLTKDTVNGVNTVSVGFTGQAAMNYLMVAFTGPAPLGPGGSASPAKGRLLIVQKAVAGSPIAYKATRKDVVKYAVKFEARKIAGQSLYDFTEFTSAAS
jgi:hypothetical protein